jgi:hypothetical protein
VSTIALETWVGSWDTAPQGNDGRTRHADKEEVSWKWMSPNVVFEIILLLALMSLNALFALSEIAIVSARPYRLRVLAQKDKRCRFSARTCC